MQIKSVIKYHLILVRMAINNNTGNDNCWRGCGKKETLIHANGNVNCSSHYRKQYVDLVKENENQE